MSLWNELRWSEPQPGSDQLFISPENFPAAPLARPGTRLLEIRTSSTEKPSRTYWMVIA